LIDVPNPAFQRVSNAWDLKRASTLLLFRKELFAFQRYHNRHDGPSMAQRVRGSNPYFSLERAVS
jgi:hypothetical protein